MTIRSPGGVQEPARGPAGRVWRARVLGWLVAQVIRAVSVTLRFRIEDRAGVLDAPPGEPMLWVFWHNRMFVVPWVFRRSFGSRSAAVLTSASGDGEVIAQVMRRFGIDAVRGSSSRRSVAALVGMVGAVKAGRDLAVTPDGPRGPRYRLQPGVLTLARLTGKPIFPVNVRYHRAWRLKTWDGFRIPVPFSRVDVAFEPLLRVDRGVAEDRASVEGKDESGSRRRDAGRDAVEADRARLEALLWTD